MLSPYIFLEDQNIYRIQEFVEHTVTKVWCEPRGNFKIELLHKDFREMVKEINPEHLLNPIKKVYAICRHLSSAQLQLLESAYYENNDIEGLCAGRGTPVLYSKLKKELGKKITNQIYIFCKNLYSPIIGLQPFYSAFGLQEDHYRDFSFSNQLKICPFCGLNRMLNHHSYPRREAYDHFFPKEVYPFSSVNFYNLAPACHHCNSSYKSRKDPINLRDAGPRRRAFYPFKSASHQIDVIISLLKTDDIRNLQKEDIAITMNCHENEEEKITWDGLYSITERYKKECCDFAFGWLADAHSAVSNKEVVSYAAFLSQAKRSQDPGGKIKVAFLEAIDL
jgi:hypothetical protein